MAIDYSIKRPYFQKIFFIRLKYIDETNTQKTKFFSDSYCEVYENLVSGTTISPDIRLKAIPFFSKQLDLIENQFIIKSDYTIQLHNLDNKLTSFFIDNIFTNQEIELYITSTVDFPTSTQKLFTGRIDSVDIGDTCSIKIKESLSYEKELENSYFKKYTFDEQDDSLDNEIMPELLGLHSGIEVKQINKLRDGLFKDVFIDGTLQVEQAFIDGSASVVRFGVTGGEIEKLISYLTEGQEVKFSGFDEFTFTYSYANLPSGYFYFATKIAITIPSPVTSNISVSYNDKSKFFNTDYLISKNKTSHRKTTNVASFPSTYTADDDYITITDDWTFLKNGDVVYLQHKTNTWHIEEFVVDYFNPANKRVYFIADYKSPINKTAADYWLHFDYVQKIQVDKKDYKRYRQNVTLKMGTGAQIIAAKAKSYWTVQDINFMNTNFGNEGNKISVEIRNKTSYDLNPAIEDTSPVLLKETNRAGGIRYVVELRSGFTTRNQLKALFDADGTLDVTVYAGGTTAVRFEPEFFLTGGKNEGYYFRFYIPLFDGDQNPYHLGVWFSNGSNSMPEELSNSTFYDNIIAINVLNTDTANQVASKFVTQFNSYFSSIFPTYCYTITAGPYVALKFCHYGNYLWTPVSMDGHYSNSDFYCIARNDGVDQYDRIMMPFELLVDDDDNLICRLNYTGLSVKQNIKTKVTRINRQTNILRRTQLPVFGTFPNIYRKNSYNLTYDLNFYFASFFPKLQVKAIEADMPDIDEGDFIQLVRGIYRVSKVDTDSRTVELEQPLSSLSSYRYSSRDFAATNFANRSFGSLRPSTIDAGPSVFKSHSTFEENIRVWYNDGRSHICDLIQDVFALYNITNYSTDDLDDLKALIPKAFSSIEIKEKKKLYQQIQPMLSSCNLLSYVDKDNFIRFKFFDITDTTTSQTLEFADIDAFDMNVSDIPYSEIVFKYGFNPVNESYQEKSVTSTYLNSIKSMTNFDRTKQIETNLIEDIFENTFGATTLKDIMTRKYFKKMVTISFILPVKYISLYLNDNVKIINSDRVSDSDVFKITSFETDGNKIKINAYKL
jgi:hypothetical protein